MSEPKIGQTFEEYENPPRDAIHVAVFPMIAGEDHLHAGQKVRIKRGTTNVALRADYNEPEGGMSSMPTDGDAIGVVDPFIGGWSSIRKGQGFYCFLTPGTVTGMQHHWKHTLIDNPIETTNEHEAWLLDFAEKYNFDYNTMVAEAISTDKSQWGRYVVARGVDLHGADDLDAGELEAFWQHIEGLSGKTFDDKHKENLGWSCSC